MNVLKSLLWLLVAIVCQVLIFDHLSFYGGIVLIYAVVLIKLPVEVHRVAQIFLGFLTGVLVDIFSNTPGMHALTATTLMFMRDPILHLYVSDPEYKAGSVSMTRIGLSTFFRYALTMVLLHSTMLYLIEAFSLFNPMILLSKILNSTVLTLVVAMAAEVVTVKK